MPLDTANYSLYGTGNAALLFIHGVGMNQNVWQPQIEYFCADYRVIVYDLLGHAGSPLPAEDAGLVNYSDQIKALLDHIGFETVSVVGHSVGALIAIDFALRYPRRVNSVVALNIVYQREEQKHKEVLTRANQVLEQNRVTGVDKTLKRWFANKTDDADLEKIRMIRQCLENANPTGYGRTYRMFARSDQAFAGRLQQLDMPVLYLTGSDDPNSSPRMSQQMAGETPKGESRVIENEAHMMAYISPWKINPVIEQFLRANN